MQLPKGIEWSAHALVVLDCLQDQAPIPTAELAQIYGVSLTYLSKQLQALVRHGLVISSSGPAGGFSLARPAEQINLAQVVEAVQGPRTLFHCAEIRCQGIFREQVTQITAGGPCRIAAAMHQAEHAWRSSLETITIRDLAQGVDVTSRQQMLESLTTQHGRSE